MISVRPPLIQTWTTASRHYYFQKQETGRNTFGQEIWAVVHEGLLPKDHLLVGFGREGHEILGVITDQVICKLVSK